MVQAISSSNDREVSNGWQRVSLTRLSPSCVWVNFCSARVSTLCSRTKSTPLPYQAKYFSLEQLGDLFGLK
jgi:hypothetical protein